MASYATRSKAKPQITAKTGNDASNKKLSSSSVPSRYESMNLASVAIGSKKVDNPLPMKVAGRKICASSPLDFSNSKARNGKDVIACKHCPLRVRRKGLTADNVCEHIIAHHQAFAKHKFRVQCLFCLSFLEQSYTRQGLLNHLQRFHFDKLRAVGSDQMERLGFFKKFFDVIKASEMSQKASTMAAMDPTVVFAARNRLNSTVIDRKLYSLIMKSSAGRAVTEVVEEVRKVAKIKKDDIFSLRKWQKTKISLLNTFEEKTKKIIEHELEIQRKATSTDEDREKSTSSSSLVAGRPLRQKIVLRPIAKTSVPFKRFTTTIKDESTISPGQESHATPLSMPLTNEDRLLCAACGELFVHSESAFCDHLVIHLSVLRSNNLSDSRMIEKFNCALCPSSIIFYGCGHLLSHALQNHSEHSLSSVAPTSTIADHLKTILITTLKAMGNEEFAAALFAAWTTDMDADSSSLLTRSVCGMNSASSSGKGNSSGAEKSFVHALDLMNHRSVECSQMLEAKELAKEEVEVNDKKPTRFSNVDISEIDTYCGRLDEKPRFT
uniref:C2H2-type domain-containing protein n=1 Tax=Plectus sambesii TaxID=2011161 RepID=A0A914XQD1_9BILA